MRIGHISDIHLRHHLPGTSDIPARRSFQAPALLARALRTMAVDGVEAIAVTGDILDIPGYQLTDDTRGELAASVVDDYVLCRELLAASGIPYLVVPGNHDDVELMAQVFDSGTGFRDIAGIRFVGFWDREDEGNVPQRVGAEAALFEEMCRDDRLQVHLQHYLLTEPPSTAWPYSYEDHKDLLDRIVASGRVRLSLSGHYHPGLDVIQVESTSFSTVPALCEYPHRYRSYEVSETSVATREHSLSQ